MKRWFVWILAWLGVVCLPLSLEVEASAHQQRQVAWNQSEEPSRELASLCSRQILRSTSRKFISSRAGPYESFSTPGLFLSADNVDPVGPPRLEDRGPPGMCCGPRSTCKAAGQAGSPKQGVERASSPKFTFGNGPNLKRRV